LTIREKYEAVSIYNGEVLMERYLTLIPLLAAVASIMYYGLSNRKDGYLRPARSFFLIGVYSIIILYAYFLYLIVSHQYQYTYVWSYSANNLSVPPSLLDLLCRSGGKFLPLGFLHALSSASSF